MEPQKRFALSYGPDRAPMRHHSVILVQSSLSDIYNVLYALEARLCSPCTRIRTGDQPIPLCVCRSERMSELSRSFHEARALLQQRPFLKPQVSQIQSIALDMRSTWVHSARSSFLRVRAPRDSILVVRFLYSWPRNFRIEAPRPSILLFSAHVRPAISLFFPTPDNLHSTLRRVCQIYGLDCEICKRNVGSQCSGFQSRG